MKNSDRRAGMNADSLQTQMVRVEPGKRCGTGKIYFSSHNIRRNSAAGLPKIIPINLGWIIKIQYTG